jgi:hypothetical protein
VFEPPVTREDARFSDCPPFLLQKPGHELRHIDSATAPLRLGRAKLETRHIFALSSARFRDDLVDRKTTRIEIHILPAESVEFGRSEASCDGNSIERLMTIARNGFQKVPCLIWIKEADAPASRPGGTLALRSPETSRRRVAVKNIPFNGEL